MWLLDAKTLRLRAFPGELPGWRPGPRPGQTPHYAILSHCWREEEVLFQDIQDLDRARGMAGFTKIKHCCEQSLKIGYKWVWVDTCCIDKSSSAELSEAINSMFKWYGHAGTCLVYLDDVDHGDPHRQDSLFRKGRWFTRGWTLQELLASKRLVFFSKDWSFLGTKGSLLTLLSAITKIPVDALSHNSSFSSFSVAQRMSWAAGRQTTRIEDQAYSLMGLFDIFMPIIYGEGSSAFRRLQLEIIQRSSDQTIFAW
ncbi:heterokaryon incompatibility protein-domain-containing protein, partial [Boletus coccyginus]